MSNFEKITALPETLGAFLASLPIADGPCDENFHRTFCDSCKKGKRENCGTTGCPHEDERNKPTWWLKQGEEPGEVLGLTIRVKAAFPIEWGREYYTVDAKKKEQRAPCTCCDNTGKVTIKGVEYVCPNCKGNWREKEVVGETTVYSVAKWMLDSISATSATGIALHFRQMNGAERYNNFLDVRAADFHDMVCRYYGKVIKVYDDYKAAMAEVKRLNAAERGKQK